MLGSDQFNRVCTNGHRYQGLVWPNGTVYSDAEAECFRSPPPYNPPKRAGGGLKSDDGEQQPCRDRWLAPFSSDSIWNTAIGSDAKFEPAELFHPDDPRGVPDNFHNDQDFLLRTTTEDPLTTWVNQGDWGADDHCAIQNHTNSGKPCSSSSRQLDGCHAEIRLPREWTSASDCDGRPDSSGSNCRSAASQSNNNAMALLLPDNETLVQMQPVYRCGFWPSPLLARWGNATDGGPQQFPNTTSIFGDGTLGAHGGSGLSSIGGSIRLGELLPDAPAISHALKIELANFWYFGSAQLQPPTEYNGGRTQYLWPAIGSNGAYDASTQNSTAGYTGTNRFVAPGALLAIPASSASSVHTTTQIGAKIKQALVDYGGYIVDGSGRGTGKHPHHNLAAICMDAEVNAEMRKAYNVDMAYPHGVSNPELAGPGAGPAAAALYGDLLRIFQALHAVANNAPASIGGGGTPRRPRKPPICGASKAKLDDEERALVRARPAATGILAPLVTRTRAAALHESAGIYPCYQATCAGNATCCHYGGADL